MSLRNFYKLALVGRPNVGKSALFNRLVNKRVAIVDEAEGTTRDRLYGFAAFEGKPFIAIDCAGIDAKSQAVFNEEVKDQALIAIEEADALIMVVDAQTGPTLLDNEVASILLKTQKPVCLAINKVDNFSQETLLHNFHNLGIKKMVAVSATQGYHVAELLETAFEGFSWDTPQELPDERTKIAIIGRPNVGKSTFINTLLDDERLVTSPIAGTTRDSIDTILEFDDQELILIDTAGIRRKKKESEVVDKFAAIRTEKAIERADVCVLLIDATQGVTVQDKHIADLVDQAGKPCLLFFNKWDLVKGFRMEHVREAVQLTTPFLAHCPLLFGSAQTGRNLTEVIEAALKIAEAAASRISTGQLNKFIEKAVQINHPTMLKGKRLRLYYMTQVETAPPTFVLFVNSPLLMEDSYKKYLTNQLREAFGFAGVPLRLYLKPRSQ